MEQKWVVVLLEPYEARFIGNSREEALQQMYEHLVASDEGLAVWRFVAGRFEPAS